MPTKLDLKPILSYLQALSRHNQKAWFEEHRADYAAARGLFEQFLDGLIDGLREPDGLQGLTAKECLARIHRDVRFSKDKSPYKTNFGALIAPGGWKSLAHGYYIGLEPGGRSIVAGGLYSPTPAQLDGFRQAVHADAAALKRITRAKAFVENFGAIEGERLKTAPKGYDRDHPELALLQLKQVTVVRRFSDQAVLAPDFARQVSLTCRALRPFLSYLKEVVP